MHSSIFWNTPVISMKYRSKSVFVHPLDMPAQNSAKRRFLSLRWQKISNASLKNSKWLLRVRAFFQLCKRVINISYLLCLYPIFVRTPDGWHISSWDSQRREKWNLHTRCDNLIRWRGQVANSSPILSVSFQRLGSRPCTHSSFARRAQPEKIQIWMHTAPKAGQNDPDPTETQMGGSARGGDLGREWIAPPTATGTRSSVWVCVSLLSAAVEREQLGAERLVVTKYSIVVTKYIPVTRVSMVGGWIW